MNKWFLLTLLLLPMTSHGATITPVTITPSQVDQTKTTIQNIQRQLMVLQSYVLQMDYYQKNSSILTIAGSTSTVVLTPDQQAQLMDVEIYKSLKTKLQTLVDQLP